MKKVLHILCAFVSLCLFFACQERMGEELSPQPNHPIVVDFSSDFSSAQTKALVADEGYESHIDHLDIFVFKSDNTLFWHERVAVSSAEGSHTLSVGTKYFSKQEQYRVYLLANCSAQMSFDEESRVLTMRESSDSEHQVTTLSALGSSIQSTLNLHLSGLNIESAPKSFLMDALATTGGNSLISLSPEDASQDVVLEAQLIRAASKVHICIREGSKVEFADGDGLYYVRNLPYKTHLLAGFYDSHESDKDRLMTTAQSNNAHFIWNPSSFQTDLTQIKTSDSHRDKIYLTTYVYEHNWADKSIFEFEPCVVVNIPLVLLTQNGETCVSEAHPTNWYKVPMTRGYDFQRNHLYKVNVEINYAGATTVIEPVIVPNIEYEVINCSDENIGWVIKDLEISQTDRPKYLTLSTDHVTMHNVSTNNTIEFTSSAPITCSITSAYYYNKFGVAQYLVKASDNAGNSHSGITISAPSQLYGYIQIDSPVPTNNTPLYMDIKVSNGEAEDQTFHVIQYPLEYITNIQGYYSYRDDFGGTTYESAGTNRYVATNSWSQSNLSWTYNTSGGGNSKYLFTSKVATVNSDGTSKIYYYKWTKSGSKYVVNSSTQVNGLNNGRMYNVKISASSADYALGVPKLDAKGWTDVGEDNKNLVSPSFMIASQLGATFSPTTVEQAASHCSYYVETYKDDSGEIVHLNDWRLPTEAEIKIIIKFQYKENAAMDEVLSGKQYWSATGSVDNPLSTSTSSNSAVRCIRNAFK